MADNKDNKDVIVGVNLSSSRTDFQNLNQIFSYENKDYTFRGEVKNYNYNSILRDKQTNIYKLFELANYYVDADDIVSGIIKRVLVPFSLSNGWDLKCPNEENKKMYKEYYNEINFNNVANSIFFELYLYAQCYVYFMPDYSLITLPPHRIRISEIMKNGEPVIEFNIAELDRKRMVGNLTSDFIDTLIERYQGYPPEITAQLEAGNTNAWVQLDPNNTFVLQESKPLWQKYAIPFISTCLKPLAKKELISYYEDMQLNIGAKGFLHAKVGHDDLLPKPTQKHLDVTAKIFQDALNKFPLAVTSHFVDAQFISVDSKGLFDNSKFTEVNSQILASGGMSPIVVTGESHTGGSYAQASLSVETASQRIKQNQITFTEMMRKFNYKIAEFLKVNEEEIPTFNFNAVNLINDDKFREEAFNLWQQGCMSKRSLLNDHYNMSYEQELERKKQEAESGEDLIFTPPTNPFTTSPRGDNPSGRPELDPKDLKDDKNKSKTGTQPKPSTK